MDGKDLAGRVAGKCEKCGLETIDLRVLDSQGKNLGSRCENTIDVTGH